jgi:hypothetical protein
MVTMSIESVAEQNIRIFISNTLEKLRNNNNTSFMTLNYINDIYREVLTVDGKIFLQLHHGFRNILKDKIYEFLDHDFMDLIGTEQHQRFLEMSEEILTVIKNINNF